MPERRTFSCSLDSRRSVRVSPSETATTFPKSSAAPAALMVSRNENARHDRRRFIAGSPGRDYVARASGVQVHTGALGEERIGESTECAVSFDDNHHHERTHDRESRYAVRFSSSRRGERAERNLSDDRLTAPMTSALYRHSLDASFPVARRGEGVYLVDTEGRRYLDASGGAAVSCLGH